MGRGVLEPATSVCGERCRRPSSAGDESEILQRSVVVHSSSFFRVGVDLCGVGGFEGRADVVRDSVEAELHVGQHAGGVSAGSCAMVKAVTAQNRPAVLGPTRQVSDAHVSSTVSRYTSFSPSISASTRRGHVLSSTVAAIWRRVVVVAYACGARAVGGRSVEAKAPWVSRRQGGVCTLEVPARPAWAAPSAAVPGEAHERSTAKAHAGSVFGSVHCGTACCR